MNNRVIGQSANFNLHLPIIEFREADKHGIESSKSMLSQVSRLIIIICTFLSRRNLVTSQGHLSQIREDTGGPYVPVREICLVAYLPLAQLTENSCPDLDLNPGHHPARPRRYCGSESALATETRLRLSLCKCDYM